MVPAPGFDVISLEKDLGRLLEIEVDSGQLLYMEKHSLRFPIEEE